MTTGGVYCDLMLLCVEMCDKTHHDQITLLKMMCIECEMWIRKGEEMMRQKRVSEKNESILFNFYLK